MEKDQVQNVSSLFPPGNGNGLRVRVEGQHVLAGPSWLAD